MNKTLTTVISAALLAASIGAVSPSHVLAATKCPPSSKNYKCHPGSSVTINTMGTFQVALAGTKVALAGNATRSARGTQIYLAPVAAPHVPKHAIAFKLFASRHIPALRLTRKGSLSQLVVSTGKWKSIKAITGSGIYAATLR